MPVKLEERWGPEVNVQHVSTLADEDAGSRIEIKKARRRAGFSIGLNLLLALAKGVTGVMAGSSALLSDAIHSASDVGSSGATYLGLWVAGKRHPSFPYGLYKAEAIAALVTSVGVLIAGYEVCRRAILESDTLPNVTVALPVALTSLVVTLAFGLYQRRCSKQFHSMALEADARDYLVDGLSTLIVVVSLIGSSFGFHLDRWAALAVAAFIFWSGGQLLRRALADLMDEAIDRQTERKIIELVESHPRVGSVQKCLSRSAGGRFIIDLDVILRSASHELADRIAKRLEDEIRKTFSRVVMVRIKTHSRLPKEISRLTPVKEPGGPIETHLARAPWFLIERIEYKTQTVNAREYLQNPYWQEKTKKGLLVGRWLLDMKPDQVVAANKKEGTAAALLKEAGVEMIAPEDLDAAGRT
jgi:cation diffusion facilitator family transporter